MAPTQSPSVYGGLCDYTKCTTVSTPCQCDSSDCPNPFGLTVGCKKTIETCESKDVEPYLSTRNYDFGDVVVSSEWKLSAAFFAGLILALHYEQRVGLDRFVCLGYPFGLWCSNPSYKPGLVDGIWSNAWRRDGVCPGGPTQGPTVGISQKLGPLRLSMLTHAFPRGSHRHLQLPVQVKVHRRVLPRRPRRVRVRAPVSHRQPTWILRILPGRPRQVLRVNLRRRPR